MSSGSPPTVDSPSRRHWSPDEDSDSDSSRNYALSGKIMFASIIVLFVVVIFLVILHLYARWYLRRHHRRNEARRRNRRNRSNRIVFHVDTNRGQNVTGGLDASLLKSLPLFVYSSETDGKMPECAVCLSEFEEGEKGRVLPKCKHSFHTECIDMWFHSNSTCPLCRSPVEPVESEMTILVEQPESVAEPGSSALLSSPVSHDREGEHTETTSLEDRRKGMGVRIDVPSRNETVAENDFRLLSPSQGFRSPGSRFLSLKRIISMSLKSPSSGVGPSCSPAASESDVESARQESAHESTLTGTATSLR